MSLAQALLAEFEIQAPVTRKFLERLPEEQLHWRPHPKSMTAGQLGYHLAVVPGGVCRRAQVGTAPPSNFNLPQPESLDEILQAFDSSIATVREVVPTFDDRSIQEPWRIVADGQVLIEMPRSALLRNIMLNHWYQHRGQLSVYLRMLNVPVPISWGPTADEPLPFPIQSQPA